MALPANVNFCTVTGRFIRAVADSTDADRTPDGMPVSGLTVVFTASVNPPVVRNVAESVTVVIDPITCTTDTSGVLLGPDGTPGVMLVASDDPDLDPHGWTWTATVSGGTFPRISTTFIAPSDGTVDLATVIPIPPSPGAQISQWQAAVTTTITARDETVVLRDEVAQMIAAFEPGAGGGGAVSSVNGETGSVVLTAADVGAAPTGHTHAISGVTGLQAALDGKQPAGSYSAVGHTHTIANITGLQTALDSKVASATIDTFSPITQAAYDALATKDPATIYFITGA